MYQKLENINKKHNRKIYLTLGILLFIFTISAILSGMIHFNICKFTKTSCTLSRYSESNTNCILSANSYDQNSTFIVNDNCIRNIVGCNGLFEQPKNITCYHYVEKGWCPTLHCGSVYSSIFIFSLVFGSTLLLIFIVKGLIHTTKYCSNNTNYII